MTDWNEQDEQDEQGDDAGLVGGGSVAETIGEGGDAELDAHGDNLTRVDEGEL